MSSIICSASTTSSPGPTPINFLPYGEQDQNRMETVVRGVHGNDQNQLLQSRILAEFLR